MLTAVAALQAAQLVVGPHGPYHAIGDAMRAARAGDTVRVQAGVYAERLVVQRPVVLLGERGAVIDGGGAGTVVMLRAPARVRGFTIRGSGSSQPREDSGLLAVGAPGLVIEDNRFEDVLFGIYLKQCDSAVIRGNVVEGKDLPISFRGDGIHLWYSHDGVIADNRVRRARDVAIWFSNGTEVRDNLVTESRYGLHYMNSQRNRFTGNRFLDNEVGAIVMYSDDIAFHHNLFANARGRVGRGLAFKGADRIVAADNVIVKNAIGIFLDDSPHTEGGTNLFRSNLVAYNDVALTLLPAVRGNAFQDNQFIDNVTPINVPGGGTALGNRWTGNYWSEYAGFDANHDGVGDTPFVFDRLSDDLLARHPELQLFSASPAVTALNAASRVFPLLSPQPVVVDSLPRVSRRRP